MKDKKLVKAAEKAKENGYEFIHTVVKYEGGKPLYHIVNIDVILQLGKWLPAESKFLEDGSFGTKVWTNLPEKSISKANALTLYR